MPCRVFVIDGSSFPTGMTDLPSGLYRKYQETHYQRAYSLQEIQEALALAGMEFVTAYDAFTKDAPRKESERIYVIAREHGKKQNN